MTDVIGGLLAKLLVLAVAVVGAYAVGLDAGKDHVQAAWDKAKVEAQAAQDAKTDKAEDTLIKEVEVIRTVYRDRTKEVKVYVPTPGTTCPADPDFVRLFNAAR